jgi:hypothetical protein
MPVSGLEAVADAITVYEGFKPGTRSYSNRNPGNLRLREMNCDDKGYTVFTDLCAGYSALLRELKSKFTGQNSHGITPTSTLQDLFVVYAPQADNNQPSAYAAFVAKYVSAALGRPITSDSRLMEIWK